VEKFWSQGDFDYDGIVGFPDLVKLAQNYNGSLPGEPIPGAEAEFAADLATVIASVPEPRACAIMVLSMFSLCRASRRRV
jgi:hypothetical protein